MPPPPIDIRAASRRVLDIINQMLCTYFWKTRIERRLPTDADLEFPFFALHNATVESSLISIRILDDVFATKRKFPDDLHQSDFPGLPTIPAFLSQQHRGDINKQIAHLTHLKLVSEQHSFPYKAFLHGAIPAAKAFCGHLLTTSGIFNQQDLEYISGTSTVLDAVLIEYVNA